MTPETKEQEKARLAAEKAEAKRLADEEKARLAAEKVDRTEATVVYRLGTRTYSKEEHGDDFMDLAKEFATKQEGKIV